MYEQKMYLYMKICIWLNVYIHKHNYTQMCISKCTHKMFMHVLKHYVFFSYYICDHMCIFKVVGTNQNRTNKIHQHNSTHAKRPGMQNKKYHHTKGYATQNDKKIWKWIPTQSSL